MEILGFELFMKIDENLCFEVMTLAIIVVNALWMGYQLDADKSLTLATSKPIFQFVENIFTIYFTIEVQKQESSPIVHYVIRTV